MSVNVYLKEEVTELAGFTSKPNAAYPERLDLAFNQKSLYRLDNRLYMTLNDSNPVPADVVDYVDEISLYDFILRTADRETGIYCYESAEGTLEMDTSEKTHPRYTIKIRAKKMEDIRQLLHLIKVGKIRPDASYEGPQCGKSRKQLEAENAELRLSVDLLEVVSRTTIEQLNLAVDKNIEFRRLANRLSEESWGFCSKKRIFGEICRILDAQKAVETPSEE